MRFVVAGPEHDALLRHLAVRMPMPGWVRIAYAREPNYFHGLGVQGAFSQVLLALEDNRALGMGCRSIRPMYINGQAVDFGYLHGLRSLPELRRAGGIARGYRFLRELHEDGRTPAYLTTVIESNLAAKALLTSGRAGLPQYIDQGQYVTSVINLKRRYRPQSVPNGIVITHGNSTALDEITEFLNIHGSRRQFFPVIKAADFGTDLLRELMPEDIVIARAGTQIVGLTGCWDQSGFKQNRVTGYSPVLSIARPVLNAVLSMTGFTSLPPSGHALNLIYASWICIANDAPEILTALLNRICMEHSASTHRLLAVGFHESDPLRSALRPFPSFHYESRLYMVHWADGRNFAESLDHDRIPYLELATL